MEKWRVPGLSVAVVHDYRIKWSRGFGLRDEAAQLRVDTSTPFQAASVSKPITALAIMIALRERGLSVDQEINPLFAGLLQNDAAHPWQLPNPFPEPVTIRMLLSHTAGTSAFHYKGYRYRYDADPPAPVDAIPGMREELDGLPPANTPPVSVIRPPGKTWSYSPAGYTVLQALLTAMYRKDFADIMSELILQPLDMNESSFAQPMHPAQAAAIATPYVAQGQPLAYGPRVFNTAASGGLTTTPTDLAKLMVALQRALKGESSGKLIPGIARAVLRRQSGRTEDGKCFDTGTTGRFACRSSWGLGFDVNLNRYLEHQPDDASTGDYFGHTGFNSGYLTVFLGSKKGGNGLVLMSNLAPEDMSGPVPQFTFMTELVRRIADEEHWR
ncbi:beta-lactamase family protein [Noviherbaspirillum sp. DKR-6]|uniref:Beta-lactamase family protein n=2 Tax=Noviherbaspirillum pedocola TaxID=2801341 RepID=A0A934SY48_9BURK|nr:beta-lactamase family protein [Noviherbaspirillum pedocola]